MRLPLPQRTGQDRRGQPKVRSMMNNASSQETLVNMALEVIARPKVNWRR